MNRRFFLIVLDGCGAGELPDALEYGASDPGSSTLSNVAHMVGGITLPNLQKLGFGNICQMDGVPQNPDAPALWGRLSEKSKGKDTVTGHWEMMGIVTDPAFPTYPNGFPAEWMAEFEKRIGTKTLGNCSASGTEILKSLGERHLENGFPIVYTSADSVFQVAAHEDPKIFGLARLYEACEVARALFSAPPHHVGRVIARPFVGDSAESFRRTESRRDWPLVPPGPTMLDELSAAGVATRFIGKTCELFPALPTETRTLTTSNPAHCAALTDAVKTVGSGFVFANLEDFDMLYGHRNDPVGFARLLEEFDGWLGNEFLPFLQPGDRVGITADHGNDPTTPSTDHSREYAPLLVFGPEITAPTALGDIPGFGWWGEEIKKWLL